jgi:prepilin-type N-terminal cleavage/methylation domain-containing protein
MKYRSRGFTLIELMVTVAILGLLTALSVTALGPLRDRYNRRQAAELVASAAARAQLSARETGRCHALEVYGPDISGNIVPRARGMLGDRLRLVRRTTADCESSLGEVELVEWVRMPGKMQVALASTVAPVPPLPAPEWRPNSRIRENKDTELRVVAPTNEQLVIRMMVQGPVCVSESNPLENCP